MITFDDLIELLGCVLIGMALLVMALAPIIWLSLWYEEKQCNTYQEITGRDTRYVTGMCYIKDNGEWFAWTEYKLRNATTGVKQ